MISFWVQMLFEVCYLWVVSGSKEHCLGYRKGVDRIDQETRYWILADWGQDLYWECQRSLLGLNREKDMKKPPGFRRDPWVVVGRILQEPKVQLQQHFGAETKLRCWMWTISQIQQFEEWMEKARETHRAIHRRTRQTSGWQEFDAAQKRSESILFLALVLNPHSSPWFASLLTSTVC